MDIFSFQTRDGGRVEVSHGIVSSSVEANIQVGDRVLRITTPGGSMQLAMPAEAWGRLIDFLSAAGQAKH